MGGFGAADRLSVSAGRFAKASALATDYLKQGKDVDWVIRQTGGKDKNQIAEVIRTIAHQQRLLPDAVEELKRKYGVKPS